MLRELRDLIFVSETPVGCTCETREGWVAKTQGRSCLFVACVLLFFPLGLLLFFIPPQEVVTCRACGRRIK